MKDCKERILKKKKKVHFFELHFINDVLGLCEYAVCRIMGVWHSK